MRLQDPQLPDGVYAFFDPATILCGETATLWVTALTTAQAGTYGVTLVATGSSETHSAVLQLTVRDLFPPQVEIIPLRGRILAGVVNVQANGYTGSDAVKYQWLIWHTDHWSLPIGETTAPTFSYHIYRGGTWRFAVRLVTASDTFLSSPVAVTVQPPVPVHEPAQRMNRSVEPATAVSRRFVP